MNDTTVHFVRFFNLSKLRPCSKIDTKKYVYISILRYLQFIGCLFVGHCILWIYEYVYFSIVGTEELLEKKFIFSEENHLHMIDHVFLPRKLPNDITNKRLEDSEFAILSLMCDVIGEFEPHIPHEIVKLFDNMHELHVPKINPNELSGQISVLQPNQMMGIYVRKANCALFMYRSPFIEIDDDKKNITLATFQANLSNQDNYGDEDDINGDIQVKNVRRLSSITLFKH